jgi:hypothetical protein
MANDGRGGRKLSLARELLLLAGGADALRMAAERAGGETLTQLSFAYTMVGGLLILRDRLRLVEQVLMGTANPGVLLCDANQADAAEEGPGILPEWSADDEVQRLKAELQGPRYRRDLAQQGQRPQVVQPPPKPDPKRSN